MSKHIELSVHNFISIVILITIYKAKIVILANYMFCRLSIILLKKITRFFDRFLLLKIYIESLIKKAYNIVKVTE